MIKILVQLEFVCRIIIRLSRPPGMARAVASILLAFSVIEGALAGDTNGGLKPESLTVAFTKAAFLNLNRNDVEAGYKVLAQTVGRKRGYSILARTQVFDIESEFGGLLQDETVRLIVVDSWRYLGMETNQITPFFVTSEKGQVGKQYLLLTRQGSGLNAVADLRGKEIAIYEVANTTQGRAWLETLLLENHCGTPQSFFARTDSASIPTTAVLPVFFGKKQACVVDRAGFELMKELNPQVGKTMQIVAASEQLVDAVICLRKSGWGSGKFRDDLVQTLRQFHLEAAGAQVLTLFKTDELIPFKEEHLDSMRKLRAVHDRLQNEGRP